jgi:tellurite resistance-related uncharacterized protein
MAGSTSLPDGVEHVRTTPEFTASTVPAGLRRAHQLAPGVWGVLDVLDGEVTFVDEAGGDRHRLAAGTSRVIPPEAPHHVEPGPEARFVIELFR